MMKQMLSNSYLFGGNAPFIEELYEHYLVNPAAVPESWREYFDQMQLMPGAEGNGGKDVAHAPVDLRIHFGNVLRRAIGIARSVAIPRAC